MYFNLIIGVKYKKKNGFLVAWLVGLDLKLGKRPLKEFTYSGISLVSWLE